MINEKAHIISNIQICNGMILKKLSYHDLGIEKYVDIIESDY